MRPSADVGGTAPGREAAVVGRRRLLRSLPISQARVALDDACGHVLLEARGKTDSQRVLEVSNRNVRPPEIEFDAAQRYCGERRLLALRKLSEQPLERCSGLLGMAGAA